MNDKHDIMRLLIRAEKARRQVLQPLLASIGLTFGQGHVRILNTLHTEDGITQKELADRVHVRRETIVRLEQGKYNPSLKLAADIAKVFDTTIENIFSYEDQEKTASDSTEKE